MTCTHLHKFGRTVVIGTMSTKAFALQQLCYIHGAQPMHRHQYWLEITFWKTGCFLKMSCLTKTPSWLFETNSHNQDTEVLISGFRQIAVCHSNKPESAHNHDGVWSRCCSALPKVWWWPSPGEKKRRLIKVDYPKFFLSQDADTKMHVCAGKKKPLHILIFQVTASLDFANNAWC